MIPPYIPQRFQQRYSYMAPDMSVSHTRLSTTVKCRSTVVPQWRNSVPSASLSSYEGQFVQRINEGHISSVLWQWHGRSLGKLFTWYAESSSSRSKELSAEEWVVNDVPSSDVFEVGRIRDDVGPSPDIFEVMAPWEEEVPWGLIDKGLHMPKQTWHWPWIWKRRN